MLRIARTCIYKRAGISLSVCRKKITLYLVYLYLSSTPCLHLFVPLPFSFNSRLIIIVYFFSSVLFFYIHLCSSLYSFIFHLLSTPNLLFLSIFFPSILLFYIHLCLSIPSLDLFLHIPLSFNSKLIIFNCFLPIPFSFFFIHNLHLLSTLLLYFIPSNSFVIFYLYLFSYFFSLSSSTLPISSYSTIISISQTSY